MRPNVEHVVVLILFLINCGNAANIFFVFGLSTYSHRITVWPLVEALADKGHNITFATTYHPKNSDPRVRELFPKGLEEKLKEDAGLVGEMNLFKMRLEVGRLGMAISGNFGFLPSMGYKYCENFLSDPEVQEYIQNNKFDLVVIDSLYNDCGLGLAAKWGAKTILFGTTHPFEWALEPFGAIPETSTITGVHLSFQYPLNFFHRVFGTVYHLANHYYRQYIYFPKLEHVLREKLNLPEMPPLAELEKQVSLTLYNSHFSEELARSLPPFYVPVGGMHCEPSKNTPPMDKDLRKFIDDSGDAGFILVSFGGEAKIEDAPQEIRNIFFETFSHSKIRIIMKWNAERPKEMPDNVFTVKWYPQKDVLASKNIRAFITHGGLLSMQEAITYGVPMIAFPIFAEQDYNAFRLERTGRGISLDVATLTAEQFQDAIHKILNDKPYKQAVEKASKLFKDRPAKPVETALWWTEYVLRHDDTSHLKPLAMDQFWFQRRLLDVWAFLIVVVTLASWLIFQALWKLATCLFPQSAPIVSNRSPKTKASRQNGTAKKNR